MARRQFSHWDGGASDADPNSNFLISYTILPSSGTANGKPIFSYDQAAAQIDRDGGWNLTDGVSLTITYGFRSTAPVQMPEDTSGFSRFSSAQIGGAELALQEWAAVANITFIRVGAGATGDAAYTNSATILFANYSAGSAGAAAFTYLATPGQTGDSDLAGDVWVNSTQAANQDFTNLGYGEQTLLHEIGHALGLEHPGDYNASDDPNHQPNYADDAVYWQDSRMFTVMSYFDPGNTGGSLPGYASGPQLHDIAAIQRLYGANTNTRTGDTVYGFNSNTGDAHFSVASATAGAVFSIWDGGGNDTLDLSGYTTSSTIDLRPESFSSAGPGASNTSALYNISIAPGVVIENAIGGVGNDIITGNDADNILDGRGGSDQMAGGLGNDTYFIDTSGDVVQELANQGIDTVRSTLNYTLGANVENLVLLSFATTGAGNELNNTLTGNKFDNNLSGGLGFDTSNYSSASTADSWHRNPDGSWTVTAGSEGTDTLTSVERAHFSDRDVYLDPAQQTFSGDGTSDILWRRSDGFLATWSMNGAVHAGSANLGGVDNSWKIAGTGDFNGDGKDDIAWLKSDGTTAIWEMNSGGATLATGGLGGVGTNWHIAGIGDFNTDGKDDLLWKSDAGQYAIWDMNGLAAQSKAVIGSVGAEWSVQAVADFNGDGSDDILWRRSDGLVAEWNTNGTAQTGSANVGAVGNEWSIVGTGDFNDDGRADILWQRADGATAIWEMNGATQIASGVIGYVGTTWHVAGVGDYNGDGHDDIFWRSDSGQLAVWTMNGLTIETTGNTGSITTDWTTI